LRCTSSIMHFVRQQIIVTVVATPLLENISSATRIRQFPQVFHLDCETIIATERKVKFNAK